MDGEKAGRGESSLPIYLRPGGSDLCTPLFTFTLEKSHSLLLLKSGKGRNTLFLNNSRAALLYQHNTLSCRKQRRKQQQPQKPTQTLKPLETEFLLWDIPSEVSNSYCRVLLHMSFGQYSPAIPTQLENLCRLLPWGSRRGKRQKLYDATESLKRNCCCMKASKALSYLTIHAGPKRAQFYGLLTKFHSQWSQEKGMKQHERSGCLSFWGSLGSVGWCWELCSGKAPLFAPSHMQENGWKWWKHIQKK